MLMKKGEITRNYTTLQITCKCKDHETGRFSTVKKGELEIAPLWWLRSRLSFQSLLSFIKIRATTVCVCEVFPSIF